MTDPVSLLVVFLQMTDGVTVFDDILPFDEVGEENLVASRNIVVQGDALSLYVNGFSCLELFDGDSHIVSRIDFDNLHKVFENYFRAAFVSVVAWSYAFSQSVSRQKGVRVLLSFTYALALSLSVSLNMGLNLLASV